MDNFRCSPVAASRCGFGRKSRSICGSLFPIARGIFRAWHWFAIFLTMRLVGNTNQRTMGAVIRSEGWVVMGSSFGALTTFLGNRSSEKEENLRSLPEDPAIRLGKAGLGCVISARPHRGGLRTLSTIRVLDTGNKARITGGRGSVRWIGSSSESGRTETGSDPA